METRKDIIAISILVLVIIIRFSPFVFSGVPVNNDGWKSYYPWRVDFAPHEIKTVIYDINMEYGVWFPMVKDQLSKGRFPHWNMYSNCGTPLYANHLVPLFHVPFAIALLWPSHLVATAYAFLMAIAGTLFFYWFLRNCKLSVFVSLFGGLVYFLSGWQMYFYPPEVATLVWIPAILLFHDRFLENNRLSDACWASFCVAQLLIAGYPLMIAHFFYFLIAYALWRKFHRSFQCKISNARWISVILMIVICGVLLSAVQNYPTFKYIQLTNRNIDTQKKMFESPSEIMDRKAAEMGETGGDFRIKDLFRDQIRKRSWIIIPTFLMDMNESRNYAGSVVVLLGLIGLFYSDKRYLIIRIFFVLFGIFFLIPPVYYQVAKIIPGWAISTHLPREVFYLLLFIMSVLGFDRVIKLEKRSSASGVLALIVLILVVALFRIHPIFSSRPENEVFRWGVSKDVLPVYASVIISSLIVLLIGLRALGRKFNRVIGFTGLAMFVIAGLVSHFYIFQYFASSEPMPFNDNMKKIANLCNNGRIVRYSSGRPGISFQKRLDYVLPPNIPAMFGIMDIFGYDSLMLASYEDFMDHAAPGTVLRSRGMFYIAGEENRSLLLSAGARYGLSDPSREPVDDLFLDETGGIKINALTEDDSSPYVRFYKNYKIRAEHRNELNDLDFTSTVLLDKPPLLPDGKELDSTIGNSALDNKIFRFERSHNHLNVDFETTEDCILYIADTYHPRWKAKLDDVEVNIINANYTFRAIAVPRGRHEIVMLYDGIDVVWGGIMSLIALIVLILTGYFSQKPFEKVTP